MNEDRAELYEDKEKATDTTKKPTMFDKIKSNADKAIDKIKDTGIKVATKIDEKIEKFKARNREEGDNQDVEIVGEKDKKESLTEKIMNMKNNFVGKVENTWKGAKKAMWQAPKERINRFIRLKIEKMIVNYLEKQPAKIKEALKDEHMCECVKRKIDYTVDEFWPDVQDEILFNIKLKTHMPALVEKGPHKTGWYCRCCRAFKSWFLYTYDPVDRSIWYSIRTFSWWLLLIIEIFPYYGVQAIFKLIYFLLMDKNDEYQLVQFITSFKRLQFLTLGCLSSVIGYGFYYYCATFQSDSGSEKVNRCAARGSTDLVVYLLELGGFGLQILLVWLAFLMVPCSQKKGVPRFDIQSKKGELADLQKEKKRGCLQRRGGRLTKFMCWELMITLISVGLFLALYFLLQAGSDLVSLRSSIFLVKTVYGLLSFPFIIFVIPQLTIMLARTRETKYNQHGRCVPYLPSVMAALKKKEKLEKEKAERKLERERKKEELKKQRGSTGEKTKEEEYLELNEVDIDDFMNNDEVTLLDDDFLENAIKEVSVEDKLSKPEDQSPMTKGESPQRFDPVFKYEPNDVEY